MSLVEQAQKFPARRKKIIVDEETIELVIAFIKGELTSSQCSKAMGIKNSTGFLLLSISVMKELYRRRK